MNREQVVQALVSGKNFNHGLFEVVVKKMSLIQRKTAIKILKRYHQPKPTFANAEVQTEEGIDNKWKVMYEVERARLKEKKSKLKDKI